MIINTKRRFTKKKVVIARKQSQRVCLAFRNYGVRAYSNDILDCSGGYPQYHIKGDVREIIDDDWSMVIAFPPCVHLCSSGARYFEQKRKDGRQQEAIDFFMMFTGLKCQYVCIENSIGIMSNRYRKPDQIIQPYWFGDPVRKSTCLWLKGLPLLTPTRQVDTNLVDTKYVHYMPDSRKQSMRRSMRRSMTFKGIANAMAYQWCTHVLD